MNTKTANDSLFLIYPALLILLGMCLNIRCTSEPKNYIEDYFPLVYRGDLDFFKEHYAESYRTLKEAADMLEPTNFEPFRELEKLANLAAKLGEPEASIQYIQQLIERGYPLEAFQRDTTYATLWELPSWQELAATYPEARKAYLKTVNHELREEIRQMNESDQRYRSRADRHEYRDEQLRLDSINIKKLQDIFEQWGYPGPQLIGYIPPDSIEQLGVLNILMRTPGDIRQEYFIPKLKTFVENGSCPPNDLGLLIDQYYLTREGYQLYATMVGPNGLFPIKDGRKLDERRLAIGLPTLKMEMQRDSVIRMSFYLEQLTD